jgi:hypothetical protein
MRGLSFLLSLGTPPYLGPPLLLSAGLSATTSTLYWNTDCQPWIVWMWLTPTLNGVLYAYYGLRCLQRLPHLSCTLRETCVGWPAVPLLPVKRERAAYMRLLWYASLAHFATGFQTFRWRGMFSRTWEDDAAEIVLTITYFAELVVSIFVGAQASLVAIFEGYRACEVGHNMRCRKCGAEEAEAELDPNTLSPPSLFIQPATALAINAGCSATLIFWFYHEFGWEGVRFVWLIPALLALTVVHHVYLLARIAYSARTQPSGPARWFTPALHGLSRTLYTEGMTILSLFYVLMLAVLKVGDMWKFWQWGVSETVAASCYGCITATSVLAFLHGRKMRGAEARAQCTQEGHQWACSRILCFHEEPHVQQTATTLELENAEKTVASGNMIDEKVCWRLVGATAASILRHVTGRTGVARHL